MMKLTEYPAIGERVYSAVLANGLELRVIPKKDFSSCYAVFATNYGGAHRRFMIDGKLTDTPAGVAHFLEHKMFDLPDGSNALALFSANGASPNAFTASGVTCYYFECTEGFEDNLRLLLHFVSTPYFTEETVSKEQGIIAQEILMGEDNPFLILYYNLLALLYEHHPIKDKVAGTVESIAQITAQTLYDCHSVFYAPSNMVLCVEGDVDPERVLAIAEELLPTEKKSVPTADFGEKESLFPISPVCREALEIPAPQLLIGAKLAPEEGGEALMRQKLIAMLSMRMLCGESSPFYTKLYEEGLLNASFDCDADFSASTATLIIGGESREPDTVFERFCTEVERISHEGFDRAGFERAKRASVGARLRGLEEFENVCVSVAIGVFENCDALRSIEILESITAEDCRAFTVENLCRERLALSIIEPALTEQQEE